MPIEIAPPTDAPSIEDPDDRRHKARFPIHRELKYRLMQDGRILEAGLGQTVNICSGGVAFSLDRELSTGTFIELSISWPVLLDNGTPMRLVVFGRVLRSGDGVSACTVDKYEFRTQARTAQNNQGYRSSILPLRWGERMTGKPTPNPRPGSSNSLSYQGMRG
jgi:hypothetical protein